MTEESRALSREDVLLGIQTLCNLAISAHICREVVEHSFAEHARRVRDALPRLKDALSVEEHERVAAYIGWLEARVSELEQDARRLTWVLQHFYGTRAAVDDAMACERRLRATDEVPF